MSNPTVWIYSLVAENDIQNVIKTDLEAAQIEIQPPDFNDISTYGILCFGELNDALLRLLHYLRREGQRRVLVVALDPSKIDSHLTWRLLHAGASDVLTWDQNSASDKITARIQRWHGVDQLAAAASARESVFGESRAWHDLVRDIVESARYGRNPVLLTGESGSGKERIAHLFHSAVNHNSNSGHPQRELVTLDCGTFSPELLGSELFGHERGAFTGAHASREGAFALANGSTLFLDEIGEIPYNLQAQLLRGIQEGTFKRVGGNVWQSTRFRLVSATNRNLQEMVAQGSFRLDLYYRIAGTVFRVPPLRERREDILPLAKQFLTKSFAGKNIGFEPAVEQYLLSRPYEGNVRELSQLMDRVAYRHVGTGPITPGDIPEGDRPIEQNAPRVWPDLRFDDTIADAIALGNGLKEITQTTAETAIRIAVQSEGGNLQRAAKRLGVTDRALQLRRAADRGSA